MRHRDVRVEPLVFVSALCALQACNTQAEGPQRLIDAGDEHGDASPPHTPPSFERVHLVDAELWEPVPMDADPFASWAEADVVCSPVAGYYPELGQLEVDTTRCNFVTLWQPLPVDVPDAALLEIEVIHFDLEALESAQARLALRLEGSESDGGVPSPSALWQREVPIPSAADRIVERFQTSAASRAGSEVLFHLQNHGQNTWRLVLVDWLVPN